MSEGRGDPLARRAAELLRQEKPDERGLEAVLAAVRAEANEQQIPRVARNDNGGGHPERSEGSAVDAVSRNFFQLTRWTALAAAAVIFAVGLGTGALLRGRRQAPAANIASSDSAAAAKTPARVVEFVFVAPSASRVALVGEFNGWDAKATPMRTVSGRGTWSVSVPLAEGRHVYAFVVDDSTWVPDPQAPLSPEQWFGERNSVVVVPPANAPTGGPRT